MARWRSPASPTRISPPPRRELCTSNWLHGSLIQRTPGTLAPSALNRFSRWTADAEIAKGAVTLKQSQVQQGARKSAVDATITFGDPPEVTFAALKSDQTAKR